MRQPQNVRHQRGPFFPLEQPPFSSSEFWWPSKVIFEAEKERVEAIGDA
jgi:hypothetical protein